MFAIVACIDNLKNLLNSSISSTYPHNMLNVGPLTAEIGWQVWGSLRVKLPVQKMESVTICTHSSRWSDKRDTIARGKIPLITVLH